MAGWSPKLGLDLEGGLSVVFQPAQKATADPAADGRWHHAGPCERARSLEPEHRDPGQQHRRAAPRREELLHGHQGDRQHGAAVLPPCSLRGQRVHGPKLDHDHDHDGSEDARRTTIREDLEHHYLEHDHHGQAEDDDAQRPRRPPKSKKVAAYVKPPPCGSAYLYTTATYSTAQQSNPGSPPDPALNSVPSTPSGQDSASRTVLVCASTLNPCPARYELGPTPYDGTVPATGEILASANAEFQTTTGWVVNFTIKSQYSAFFDTIAKKYYHLPLAVDLGGQVESAPTLNAQSFGGSGQISGSFTQPQATGARPRPQVRPDPDRTDPGDLHHGVADAREEVAAGRSAGRPSRTASRDVLHDLLLQGSGRRRRARPGEHRRSDLRDHLTARSDIGRSHAGSIGHDGADRLSRDHCRLLCRLFRAIKGRSASGPVHPVLG